MFTFRPIGYVHSPYKETSSIPRGLGAKHEAEGDLELLRAFEPGLADIEGFSHLFVIWAFDRAEGYDLIAHPPTDQKRPHGVFSTRSPRRPNPIAPHRRRTAPPRRKLTPCPRRRHARRHAHPRHQALSVQHPRRKAPPRLARRSRKTKRVRSRPSPSVPQSPIPSFPRSLPPVTQSPASYASASSAAIADAACNTATPARYSSRDPARPSAAERSAGTPALQDPRD